MSRSTANHYPSFSSTFPLPLLRSAATVIACAASFYWMAMRDQRRHVESWLTPSDLVAARNWDAITALAEASGLTP